MIHSLACYDLQAYTVDFFSRMLQWQSLCSASRSSLSVDNNTTVGVESLSTEAGTVWAGQEDERGRNLRRLAGSADGRSELRKCFVIHGSLDQRRPHRSRCDCIDTDTLRAVLVGQTAGERDDGALGAGVVEKIWASNVGID